MLITIILFPLIGFCLASLFGRIFSSKGIVIITTTFLSFSFILSVLAFYKICITGSFVYLKLYSWISCGFLNVDWGFLFDTLTIVMCCVVTFVSFLVHLYSTEYMSHDPHLTRFMSYLSLFTFFMLILVTADNFVQMFVGWEGVGLSSFLLINFWFTRLQANKAAIQAMVLNRIGDFGLVLGILILLVTFKSADYATVFALAPLIEEKKINFLNFKLEILNLIAFFIFFGAIGKSAQLGLHTWLPSAMEGPTPVSALIHAATMVTAGVFLIARSSSIFEFSNSVLNFVIVLGSITAFFSATVGLVQNDLKKVIAYSTCSQLGYMVFSSGLSNYPVGLFHLSNHAFFKALLFLGAGSVIHAVSDEQDMRKLGGLKKLVPFTYSSMVIGSLALMGFPFLTGFYSKDLILEVAFGRFSNESHFSFYLGTTAAFLTAYYSTRLILLTFLVKPNGFKIVICRAFDSSWQICLALMSLIFPSIFLGYLTKEAFVGLGCDLWQASLFANTKLMNRFDSEFIPITYKLLPLIFSNFGLFSAFLFYVFNKKSLFQIKIFSLGRHIYTFLNRKWFFDKLYNEIVTQSVLKFGFSISYKMIDRGIIEVLGPNGISKLAANNAVNFYGLQTSLLYHYLFVIVVNIILFFLLFHNYIFLIFEYQAIVISFINILFISNVIRLRNLNKVSSFN